MPYCYNVKIISQKRVVFSYVNTFIRENLGYTYPIIQFTLNCCPKDYAIKFSPTKANDFCFKLQLVFSAQCQPDTYGSDEGLLAPHVCNTFSLSF